VGRGRRAAPLQKTPAVELVRETILALARKGGSRVCGAIGSFLVSPSERMLRYTSFPATENREVMVRERRDEEFIGLVAESCALHDEQRWGASDRA